MALKEDLNEVQTLNGGENARQHQATRKIYDGKPLTKMMVSQGSAVLQRR